MPIAAIILAAGSSSRLGRPKQTVVLAGETLVERAVRVATEAGLSPVIAVILDSTLIDRLQQAGATVLLNRKAYEGMSTSIHTGIRWAKSINPSGAVLMACDQPALTSTHLRALCEQPDSPTGSGYSGKIGIPAYFPASCFDSLLQLQGDTGARDLLRSAHAVAAEDLTLDIDSEADLQRARTLLEPAAPKP